VDRHGATALPLALVRKDFNNVKYHRFRASLGRNYYQTICKMTDLKVDTTRNEEKSEFLQQHSPINGPQIVDQSVLVANRIPTMLSISTARPSGVSRKYSRYVSTNPTFIYTQSVPRPTLKEVGKSLRFLLRMAQLACAITAFGLIASSAFNVNYPFWVLGASGINFSILTSLSSVVSVHLIEWPRLIFIVCFYLKHVRLYISSLSRSTSSATSAV
jgi:hypothetical protein